jgi:hypothetical protein
MLGRTRVMRLGVIAGVVSSCAIVTSLNDLGGADADMDASDASDASLEHAATYVPGAGLYYYDPKQIDSGDTITFMNDASINVTFAARMACIVDVDGGAWAWQLTEANGRVTSYFFSTSPNELDCTISAELIASNAAAIGCDPIAKFIPVDLDSGVQAQSCLGANSLIDGGFSSSGPYSFIGVEPVDLPDGAVIEASYHFHEVRNVTGTQTGTSAIDWWLDTTTGLPLHIVISTQVTSPSPLGPAKFDENVDYTIESTIAAPLPPLDAGKG